MSLSQQTWQKRQNTTDQHNNSNIREKPIFQGYNKFLFRQEVRPEITNAQRAIHMESGVGLRTKLNIQFQEGMSEDDSSEHSTQSLKSKATKRKNISPIKIIPEKLPISNTKKTVARKTIARKAPEPRRTLEPPWNIVPDGTISNFSPTTISLDRNNRKNTVIRK